MRTLRDLVDLAFTRHNARYGTDLERLAKANGYKIVSQTINQIRNGTYRSRPENPTIDAIAFLAGVPVKDAYVAAGLPIPGPPLSQELPDGVNNLSPKARDLIIRVARFCVESEQGNPGNPPPSDYLGHGTYELRLPK